MEIVSILLPLLSIDWTSGVDTIAFDWITGNLYIAGWTWDMVGTPLAYIAVCNPEGTHCVRIVDGFEALALVLDPNEGYVMPFAYFHFTLDTAYHTHRCFNVNFSAQCYVLEHSQLRRQQRYLDGRNGWLAAGTISRRPEPRRTCR